MTVVEDLRNEMPLREISMVSGISLSSLYYKEKERRVSRLLPQIEQDSIMTSSERPTLRVQGSPQGEESLASIFKTQG